MSRANTHTTHALTLVLGVMTQHLKLQHSRSQTPIDSSVERSQTPWRCPPVWKAPDTRGALKIMLPAPSPSNPTLVPQKSTPQTEEKVVPVIQADSPWVSESSSSDAASQPIKTTPGCPKTLPVKTNGVALQNHEVLYALLCAAKQARTSEGVVEAVPVIGTAVAAHPVLVPNATPIASMQLMEAGGHGPSDYFMLPASVDISTGQRALDFLLLLSPLKISSLSHRAAGSPQFPDSRLNDHPLHTIPSTLSTQDEFISLGEWMVF